MQTFERITDPLAFYEMWADDQLYEDNSATYRAPDGELFQVAQIHSDGSVVSDTGRSFTVHEFNQCKRVAG